MELYIVRHSDAVPHGTMRDPDRPLTDEGLKKMTKIATAMRKMGLTFDAILSSPYTRARETAEIAGEILECKLPVKLTPSLASDGNPADLLKEINDNFADEDRIMIVGHEPYLTILISILVSGRNNVSIKLGKAGVCKLTVERLRLEKCARLEWLMGAAEFTLQGSAGKQIV